MPSKEKHKTQYLRNKQIAGIEELVDEDNYDWKITILFYAGLHCLETTFADDNFHPTTHNSRKSFLESNKKYQDILDCYDNLEMLSRNSRYECIKMNKRKFDDALGNVEEIEQFVKDIS